MTARQWQVSFMNVGKGNLICLKPQRSTFAEARTRNPSYSPISHSAPQYNQLGIEPYHAKMHLRDFYADQVKFKPASSATETNCIIDILV